MRSFLAALLLASAIPPGFAVAEIEQFFPARDNTLCQDPDGLLSNGGGQYLFAGRTVQTESFSRRRALLQFDLTGAIPAGSKIISASLQMYMSRTSTSSATVTLYRALADWGEGDSDALKEEGTGAPAAPGDATWIHRMYDDLLWNSPGGDFDPSESQSITVVGLGNYAWSSNTAMVADVQQWVDHPQSNFGWIVIGDEFIAQTAKRFNTREHPDLTRRPVLVVEFVQPIPASSTASILLLGIGLTWAAMIILKRNSDARWNKKASVTGERR